MTAAKMGEAYGHRSNPVLDGPNTIIVARTNLQGTLVGLMRWRKLFKICFPNSIR